MRRLSMFSVVLLLLLGAAVISTSSAQVEEDTCPVFIEDAISAVGDNCGSLGRNNACYGYTTVLADFTAEVAPEFFTEPSDRADLLTVENLNTSPMRQDLNEWGIALLSIQANLPDTLPGQAVVFMLAGDVEYENAVEEENVIPSGGAIFDVTLQADANLQYEPDPTSNLVAVLTSGQTLAADAISADGAWIRVTDEATMIFGWVPTSQVTTDGDLTTLTVIGPASQTVGQAFYFRTSIAGTECQEAPQTLIVQGPQDLTVDITANGADLRLGSTAALRTLPATALLTADFLDQYGEDVGEFFEVLEVTNFDGTVILDPDTEFEVELPVGYRAFRCLSRPDDLGVDGNDDDRTVYPECGWLEPRSITRTESQEFSGYDGIEILNYPLDIPEGVEDDEATATATATRRLINLGFATNTPAPTFTPTYTPIVIPPPNTPVPPTTDPGAIDLALDKTASTTVADGGDPVVYTVTVYNSSSANTATNILVGDSLPAAVNYVSSSATIGSYDVGLSEWTIPSLPPQTSAVLTINTIVDLEVPPTTVTNTAAISSFDQPDPNTANNTDSVSFTVGTVLPDVDLSVTKTVDNDIPDEGDTIVYTITVDNLSTEDATNITIADSSTGGVTYVSDTPSAGTYDPVAGEWQIPLLAAGDQATLDITVTVDAGTGGTTITNTASIVAVDQPDPNSANDSAFVDVDVQPGCASSIPAPITTPEEFVCAILLANVDPALDNLTLAAGATFSFISTYADNTALPAVTTPITISGNGSALVNNVLDAPARFFIVSAGGVLTLNNLTMQGGNADVNDGGAILVQGGALTVDAVDFANNFGANGGAVAVTGGSFTATDSIFAFNGAGSGAGVYAVGSSSVSLSTTALFMNTAFGGGGGAVYIDNGAALSLASTDFDSNTALTSGGGLYVASGAGAINASVTSFLQNSAPTGAAVYTNSAMTMNSVRLLNNGDFGGGGVRLERMKPARRAAAQVIPQETSIYIDTSGSLTLTQSLIAFSGGDGIGGGGSLTATNVTLSQNNFSAINMTGSFSLNFATVVFNGDVALVAGSGGQVKNSLFSGNTDLCGTGVSFTGNNVSDDTTGCPSGITQSSNVDIDTALDVNGGFAETHALLSTSAAIDAASDCTTISGVSVTVDQRGVSRPIGGACDLGAYEAATGVQIDLAISKSVDVPDPNEGDTVVFDVIVTNTSTFATATNIVIGDLLPAGVTYVSHSAVPGTYNQGSGVWTIPSLGAGAQASLSITVTVDAGTGGTTITNTATLNSFDQTDAVTSNNSASASLNVAAAITVDLGITKTVDDTTPSEGGFIDYTITITNLDASVDVTGVEVTDLLPVEVSYLGDSPEDGTYDEVTGIWSIPLLAAGDSSTLVISVIVNVGTAGTDITNTATITASSSPDPDGSNDSESATITPTAASIDLSLSKNIDNTAPLPGDTITYTIFVSNNGFLPGSGIEVTDILPPEFIYVSHSASFGTYDPISGIWTIPGIGPEGSESLDITGTVSTGAAGVTFDNTASITAFDQSDPNPANDSDTATVTVLIPVDVDIDKSVSDFAPPEGSSVVFSVEAANNGANTATNIQVQDVLPSGVTFVSASASAGTYNSGTGIWTIPSIAAGNDVVLDITVTVNSGTAGSPITNTASVIALDPSQVDTDTTNDSDSESINPVAVIEIGVAQDPPSPTNPAEGEITIFTINVTNNHPSNTATGIVINVPIPANATGAGASESTGTYDSGTGIWTIPSLAAGASANIQLGMQPNAGTAGGTVTVTATFQSANETDTNGGNNSASQSANVKENVDLALGKTTPSPSVLQGSNTSFFVGVQNPSTFVTATNVVISDPIPAGATFVSSNNNAPGATYDEGTGLWTIPSIPPGTTYTLEIVVTASGTFGQDVINTATLQSLDQNDTNGGNNSASAQFFINIG